MQSLYGTKVSVSKKCKLLHVYGAGGTCHFVHNLKQGFNPESAIEILRLSPVKQAL